MSDSLQQFCKTQADKVKSGMQNDRRVMSGRKQDGGSATKGYF